MAHGERRPYEDFRNHVRMQANTVLYHRGKLKTQVNSVETALGPQGSAAETMSLAGGGVEDAVMAVMRRFGLKGGGKGGGKFGGGGAGCRLPGRPRRQRLPQHLRWQRGTSQTQVGHIAFALRFPPRPHLRP